MDGVTYWRSHDHEWPSILRALGQSVFDALASAVVMERDVCAVDMFIPRKRSALDPANLRYCLVPTRTVRPHPRRHCKVSRRRGGERHLEPV